MVETETITTGDLRQGFTRVAQALEDQSQYLTRLDQAMGDGDLGITATKIARALQAYAEEEPPDDLGKYLMTAGMKVNSAAPSTMGTLLATALMRAGKEAQGDTRADGSLLAAMLHAADQGIQERGKAQPGDKTIVDALHPAADAFEAAVDEGQCLADAGEEMLAAAEAGRDAATPLRSSVGRAGWVGERTEGKVDPGCALLVVVLRAALDKPQESHEVEE